MRKKMEKMFHARHKVDMRACYAKQKINLTCPKMAHLPQQQPLSEILYITLLSDTVTPSSDQISF